MSGADLPASLDPTPARPPDADDGASLGVLARAAARFTAWAERWIPDAFVFALAATLLVFFAAVATTETLARDVAADWGDGFWSLVPFTLRMSLIIITGCVVATAPPIYRLIARIASIPREPRMAIAMVALFAMLSSWLNWGFSLIFSAMLAKEVARRVSGVDYRAVAASAFLGLGSVWAQGLSGSAALQMATKTELTPAIREVISGGGVVKNGVIPFAHTIFLWQSLLSVGVELVIVTTVMYFAAPRGGQARTAASLGIELGASPLERAIDPPRRGTKGEWLEHRPWLIWGFVLLSGYYLFHYFKSTDQGLNALDLDRINIIFLTIGAALHGTPARLMRAVREATPGVWGVILQFPFYAGIGNVIAKTHLNEQIAKWFVGVSTRTTFPAIAALYSTILGVFVPSGGTKWVIEAPYIMRAAHDLKVHLGWMVAVYDLGEALSNLVQPFWMLPILGLFGLRARDVMGYTFLVFVVLLLVVLILVTVLGATLSYPL